jgi:hypothetical protein
MDRAYVRAFIFKFVRLHSLDFPITGSILFPVPAEFPAETGKTG